MTTSETEIISGETTDTVTLSNGLEVDINRLKTRETMKLLRILTRGAGYALSTFNLTDGEQEFAEQLMVAVVFAIPEAENETIEFIQAMASPSKLIMGAKSKAEKEINEELVTKYDEALTNPELEDLIVILEKVVQNEAPHIEALGKRIGLLMKTLPLKKS